LKGFRKYSKCGAVAGLNREATWLTRGANGTLERFVWRR
jgi:hypothetical protein